MEVKDAASFLTVALFFTLGVIAGFFGPNRIPYLALFIGSGTSLFCLVWLLIEVAHIKGVTK